MGRVELISELTSNPLLILTPPHNIKDKLGQDRQNGSRDAPVLNSSPSHGLIMQASFQRLPFISSSVLPHHPVG